MENRIKELRLARKWSMAKLAERANTSQQQIDKLEKGRNQLTVRWMERLAKALDCSTTDLLPDSLSDPAPPKPLNRKVLEAVLLRLDRTMKEEKIVLKPSRHATLIIDLYEIGMKYQRQGLNAQNPDFMRDFSMALAKAMKK